MTLQSILHRQKQFLKLKRCSLLDSKVCSELFSACVRVCLCVVDNTVVAEFIVNAVELKRMN